MCIYLVHLYSNTKTFLKAAKILTVTPRVHNNRRVELGLANSNLFYYYTVYVVYLAVILIWWFGELQVNRQI